MKYKIEKGTPLFTKLDNLGEQIRKVNKQACDLVKEMGFSNFHPKGNFILAGGISAVHADKKPKDYAFAYGSSEPNAFFPRKIKTNKELLAKINALPTIDASALNDLVNFDPFTDSSDITPTGGRRISFHPGIAWKKKYILIDIANYYEDSYKPAKHMIEITTAEFKKLKAGR